MTARPPPSARMKGNSTVWKNIATWTGIGIISFLCLLLISVVLGRIDFLGYSTYYVASGSMSPTLDVGDVVYVTDGDPKVGDIVVLSVDGQLVTHRIVGVEDGRFITKGDANEYSDTFAKARIVGVVRFHMPLVGRLALGAGAYLSDRATANIGLRAAVRDTSTTTTTSATGQEASLEDANAPIAEEPSGEPTTSSSESTTTTTTVEIPPDSLTTPTSMTTPTS